MTDSDVAAGSVLEELRTPEGRALVASLIPYDAGTAMARLEAARSQARWAGRGHVVAAAATQARLRTAAAQRFPGRARWWTPEGLEQATRPAVADRHARRFVDAGITAVTDLGCGAGSDALAFAGAGLSVLAIDRQPEALAVLQATAADWGLTVRTRLGDVTALSGPWDEPRPAADGAGCFVDPARRDERGRTHSPQRWSPPWSWVCALAERVPATGAKVAPGIDHTMLPPRTQTEWVSVDGVLVEAGVWWGPLRHGAATRQAAVLAGPQPSEGRAPRATVLDDSDGVPVAPVRAAGGWLVEPDAAVIRAGLVSLVAEQVGGWLLDPHIAYVATDREPPHELPGDVFHVVSEVPFGRKHMREWLRTRGYADVVVKKRGLNLVPEQVRSQLRLGGGRPVATLVLTRTTAGPLALLVERRT